MGLPAKNQPEFHFTLYFDNLFDPDDLTKRVAISTNSNRSPLITYNPLYRYYFTADAEAISISKTLAANPSNFRNIPTNIIPANVVLSRQLVGTKFVLTMTTFLDLVPTESTIFKGQIGKVTQRIMSVDLELVSVITKLNTTSSLKTSVGCMNTLGTGKCTVSRDPVTVNCLSISGTSRFLIGSGFTLNPAFRYELIVGTTKYLIDETLSSNTNIKVVGLLQGLPQKVTIQKHCNKTISTCRTVYNNIQQFNGSLLINSDSLTVNV